jgi:uncharacterized protein YegP (UPF0339 family)
MSGSFEIKTATSGDTYFVLKAGNGEVILQSEMYTSKSSAITGIASNCVDAANFEKLNSSNEKFYFNLKAANHQVIGTSQMYEASGSRDHGIESVKMNGASGEVTDNTR